MGVKLISMHFRHHNLETEEDDISKLNFRIRANGWFLAGLYVKGKWAKIKRIAIKLWIYLFQEFRVYHYPLKIL